MSGGGRQAASGECRQDGEDQQRQADSPSLRDQVLTLFKKGDASTLLALISGPAGPPAGETDGAAPWDPLLLWVRPKHCCLHALAAQVKHAGLSALASVGCGTGLLEWLIHALTGLSVIGYEVNADWWTSRYSPPTFIPLTYVDPDAAPPYVPPTHALMCCYFNNGEVFRGVKTISWVLHTLPIPDGVEGPRRQFFIIFYFKAFYVITALALLRFW